MARFIPKQFAENSTTSVVFGSHQEQGGNPGDGTISSDPATLQGGTAWPLGWSAATDNFFQIPRGEEMEGLERVLSAAIIQQFKDGLTFWQSEMPVTQYQTIVQYQTGSDLPKLYVNITGASTSTPPDSDTTNWFMFFDTAQVSANIALTNSPYTTNRILEIPQDIKLELSNGTLTLKAGSKVYVPNGFESDGTTPKFDVVTIDSDKTRTDTSSITNAPCFYIQEENRILPYQGFSGSTAPTFSGQGIWYDTTNNVCKRSVNGGSTWDTVHASLPYALVTNDGTEYKSIDQIFNGFGYIGSTVFVFPNVKGQYANGRNADGTCKSIVSTTTKVYAYTPYFGSTNVYDVGVWLRSDGTFATSDQFYYDSDKNQIIYSANNTAYTNICIAKFDWVDEKIISLKPYTVDSVLNSNLSNLSATGEAHFANPSLSNLTNGLTNTICTTMPTTVTTATSRKPAVVIQNYRSAAGFFRVWSDGFIEQGGIEAGGPNSLNVNFFVPFSSTTYVAEVTGVDSTSTGYIYSAYNRTTTGMTIYTAYGGATAVCAKSWYVCGY